MHPLKGATDAARWTADLARRAAEEAQRAARARLAMEARRNAATALRDRLEVAVERGPFAAPRAAAVSAVPGPATPPSPDVQAAVEEVRAQSEPYRKAEVIQFHLGVHADDPGWRAEFLRALGPEEAGTALAAADPTEFSPSGFEAARATELLAAASDVYAPDELVRMLETVPSDVLAGLIESALMTADNPHLIGTGQGDEQMARLAKGLGGIATALGADHPVVTQLLDGLVGGPSLEEWGGDAQSRAELAGWLVARSESEALQASFVATYLPQFDPESTTAPALARALAMVMGSMDPPSVSLAPLVTADPALRTAFVTQLLKTGDDAVAAWPFAIGRDVRADVVTFLVDVARLNPALYPGHESDAALLRVEAFRAGVQAIDDPLWAEDGGFERALANMLAADTDTIVGRLADGAEGNTLFDPEGHVLARFFEEVVFRPTDQGAAEIALEAVRGYLGIGVDRAGLADRLASSQGDPDFMAEEGNQLATRLGFVMGALYQGANAAVESIDGQRERDLAVVRVLGALVEETIDHSPVSTAYDLIKSGSDDRASVDAVADWLYDTYGPGADHRRDREATTHLIDGLLNGSMRPFFAEEARQGARPEHWFNMLALVNVGAAQADGLSEPGFRLSP